MPYHIRPATLADRATLVHHRVAMFTDMGLPIVGGAVAERFGRWLDEMMPAGTYHAWVVETADGDVVGGGGLTLLPWPPGPHYVVDRIAFVYNVYTEQDHRRRGLARMVMDTIHTWCRETGITSVVLNASEDGRPLYESMGYSVTTSPMMFRSLT